MTRAKSFIPLESDPSIFTSLSHELGASGTLSFVDIWSLDDPDQLAVVPRPVLAFVLVLFTPVEDQRRKAMVDGGLAHPTNPTAHPDKVVWFKQTIYNACGLYALLHAVCNIQRKDAIESSSILSNLLASAKISPAESTYFLEHSRELEDAYRTAALQGSTSAPGAEDEVDYHYICFSKGEDGLSLYELDGDLKGPLLRASLGSQDEEAFFNAGLEAVRGYVREKGEGQSFSLMALVDCEGGGGER